MQFNQITKASLTNTLRNATTDKIKLEKEKELEKLELHQKLHLKNAGKKESQ